MIILAIDPGASGAIVYRSVSGVSSIHKMPKTERDIYELFQGFAFSGADRAYIEKVGGMPGQGGSASFNFGRNYGCLRMALIAAGIPFEEVSPGKWQRGFNLPSVAKAGSKTAKKNAHKARAQERFPQIKVTHALADALLISEWAAREVGE